jgi:hypothetical protein
MVLDWFETVHPKIQEYNQDSETETSNEELKSTKSEYSILAAISTLPPGIITKIGQISKHASNPLFNQTTPWEPRLDNGYPNIIKKSSSSYECFYGDCVSGCGKQILLYANSTDGLVWNKPNLGIYDVGQVREDLKHIGKNNNIIMNGGGIGVYYDAHETNTSQSYKAFGCIDNNCGGTATSSNGFTWENKENVKWPSPQRYDTHTNSFWN